MKLRLILLCVAMAAASPLSAQEVIRGKLEQAMGIEPMSKAWDTIERPLTLPCNDIHAGPQTRLCSISTQNVRGNKGALRIPLLSFQ